MSWLGLNAKTVVITGAGGGIGQALARAFAEQGARVALLDRDLTRSGPLAEELGGGAFACGYIGPAAAFMLLLSPVILAEPMRLTLPVVGSIVALGVLGTGVAYVWNQNTLRAWGPTRASTVTYITPVVGVGLGILVLGERISWNEPVGAAVVFLGILLVQQRIRLPRRILA